MPLGISRFTAPVVSLAILMPVTAVLGQEPRTGPAPRSLEIAETPHGFVTRGRRAAPPSPGTVRLGSSVRLDHELVAEAPTTARYGDRHDAR